MFKKCLKISQDFDTKQSPEFKQTGAKKQKISGEWQFCEQKYFDVRVFGWED